MSAVSFGSFAQMTSQSRSKRLDFQVFGSSIIGSAFVQLSAMLALVRVSVATAVVPDIVSASLICCNLMQPKSDR